MTIFTNPKFWAATAERAVKTAAQSVITLIGADQVGILDLDWPQIGGVTATMTLISVLTSIASGTGGQGPSLSNSEQVTKKENH